MSPAARYDPQRLPQTPRAVLVRAPNWVGDAILAVPAIQALRAAFPTAHLAVLAVPWVADVFRCLPGVNEVLVFDRNGIHRGLRGVERMASEIRARRFDVAISLPRSASSAWLLSRSGIACRAGFADRVTRRLYTHAVAFPGKGRPGHHELELHLELVRGLGIPAPLVQPTLTLNADLGARREALLTECGVDDRPYLAMAPGAAFGGAKRWSAAGFAGVADRAFTSLGLETVLLGSPGERVIARELASCAERAPVDCVGRIGLADALALIAGARALVTNDSGLMHAAAALGTPVVAIFGPTDWIATGPASPRSRVVREPVACAPCFLRDCPIDHRCMTRVGVDAVWQSLTSLVASARPSA